MQKPKIGQQVIWKSPVPEERLRGKVSIVGSTGVRIKFDEIDPQKHVKGETLIGSGGTSVSSGVQRGNESFFPWHEYERCFSEEEEN